MKITRATAILAIGIVILFTSSGLLAQTATGTPPYASFQPGGFDSINLQNMNVNFAIPIVHSPGRGMNLDFSLVYNSSFWMQSFGSWVPNSYLSGGGLGLTQTGPMGHSGYSTTSGSCMVWVPPVGRTPGFWNTEYYTTYGNYYFTDANGTVHFFSISWIDASAAPDCGVGGLGPLPGYAVDGSGIYYDPNSDTITFSSGAKQVGTSIGGSSTLYDPNGNYISQSGGTWTDTTNRAALVVTPGTSSTTYQVYAPTGVRETITVLYASYNIKTNFGCSGVSEYSSTASLPYEIDLPNGKKYTITYEATPGFSGYTTGRIKRVTLPTGGYYEYDYSATNDGINCTNGSTVGLSRVVNDGTTSNTWTYSQAPNTPGTITTVTEPQMSYDTAANQCIYAFTAAGQEVQENHYQGPSTGTPLRTIFFTIASNGSPSSRITELDTGQESEVATTYDNNGNLTKTLEYDWGPSTPGSLVRETDMTYAASAPFVLTQKLVKDASGTVVFREDLAYDGTTPTCITGVAQHDDTHYGCSFNTRGNLTSITTYLTPATGSGGVTKSFTYDVFGNVLTAQLNCCQQKQFNYSATTNYSFPDSVVRGPSTGTQLTTSATYNSSTGLVASTTDENGQATTYGYDVYKRMTTVTRPDGTHLTTSYDDTNLIVTSTTPVDGSHSANQLVKYDGLGRPLTTTLEDAASTVYSIVQTQYDPVGRAYKSSNPYTSSASYWTETRFDGIGRALKTILPDSSNVTASFSGNCATSTDPAGKARKSCSDGLGHLSKVYEDPSSLNYETDYSYNLLDELTGVTQGSQTRSYTYDGLGRLTQSTTPESGTVCIGTVVSGTCQQNGYNSFNLVTTKTDARGVVTNLSYDTLNRLTGISYNVGSTGVTTTASVTYGYDYGGSSANSLGRLTSMTDGLGSETYAYDLLGRRTGFQKYLGGVPYTTYYSYNLAGETTQISYPSGRIVIQAYDAIGRLCGVGTAGSTCTSGTNYASGFNYNAAGEATGFIYGNGIVSNLSYSPDRLQLHCLQYDTTTPSNPDPCTKDSSALFMLTYQYGSSGANNGQISGISDSMDSGRTAAYSYDALGRLGTAGTAGSTGYAAWGLSWTYDRYGNRTAQTNTAGSVPSDSLTVSTTTNQITGTGYSYDAAGNMTGDYVNTLTYDAASRLISSSNGSSSGAYAYDGKGMRVKKCVPNCSSPTSSTTYIYSGGKVIEEYDGAGNPSTDYIYSGSQLVASVGPDVTNPGFESGLSGWSTAGSATLVSDATRAHSGSNYVQLSASPTDGPFAMWGAIAVTPGEQVTFGGWVYRESGTGGGVGWLIQTEDATHAAVSWPWSSPFPDSTLGAWVYEVGTYTVPVGVAYVQLYCTVYLPTTSTVLRCDDGFLMAGVNYYHPDHLSNRVITNSAGAVIEQMGHLPYGENWYDTGSDKWRFTTYERDAESGNDYAMSRYDVNRLGRFSSPDPLSGSIFSPQSLNRYSYTANDPINLVDPSGAFYRPVDPVDPNDPGSGPVSGPSCFNDPLPDACSPLKGLPMPTLSPGDPAAGGGGTAADQIARAQALAAWIIATDPDCGAFFGQTFSENQDEPQFGAQAASDLLTTTPISVNPTAFNPIYGYAGPGTIGFLDANTPNPGFGAQIFVASDGGFFQQTIGVRATSLPHVFMVGPYLGGNLAAQITLVLHEFAHDIGRIKPDGISDDGTGTLSGQNTQIIVDNCGAAINALTRGPGG